MTKEKKSRQNRITRHITLSQASDNFLKKQVTNASRFIDRLLEEAEKGIGGAYITIAPIEGQKQWARRGLNPRPLGYEPSALTGLSYGPR